MSYRFDAWMSRGPIAVMTLLAGATLAFVVTLAVVVAILRAYPADNSNSGFWDIAWGNLMRTLDPGTMGADSGWGYRLLMLVVTLGGLVVVASLIGIISGAFNDKMVDLRRGRSRVLERGHTVILGWNAQLFAILSELCAAGASGRGKKIVVLADIDKVEMDEQIRKRVPLSRATTVICRRGNPLSPRDVDLASPTTAASVVVLASDEADHPDAVAMKTVMSLSSQLPGEGGPAIISELRERSNLHAARLAGRGRARWILADELISRITVQTCLQRGLSTVCTELLDFDGDEIYFARQTDFVGATYLDAQLAFTNSIVIGIVSADGSDLNPPAERIVEDGDALIVIAADDSAVAPAAESVVVNEANISPRRKREPAPERTLILGWNRSLPTKLVDFAAFSPVGSTVDVVADVIDPVLASPPGISVRFTRGDTTDRSVLERLEITTYDHVLVLAYRESVDPETADARTIVTLLHLRELAGEGAGRVNIVSEMLDDANRELAEATRADDFIVSDRLVSLMLSQISENYGLLELFEELFSSGGSEVYLRAAEDYVRLGSDVDFYTVATAAARQGQTAVGYRIAAQAQDRVAAYGIHLNPFKPERLSFSEGDAIIVIADD